MKIDVDFNNQELEDLSVVLDMVLEDFDFHGDFTDMQKPVDKLINWLHKEGY